MKGKEKSFEPINYVHRHIIHNENIGKEKKYEGKNLKYEYTFSPFNFYPITEKPNNVKLTRPFTTQEILSRQSKREYQIELDPISRAFGRDRVSKSIAKMIQTPKEKYQFPQTSTQEIGWYSKPLITNYKWNRPKTQSQITTYADDYLKSFAINPFKLPSSSLKMK